MRVWTKQHKDVLKNLEEKGRHIANADGIKRENGEHADLWIEIYKWYTNHASKIVPKPDDVQFPIWLALAEDSRMILDSESVVLSLEIPEQLILPLDIEKWGNIANFFYLPADEADARRHQSLLNEYGTNDSAAYMSQFCPQIRQEIVESWPRLFDNLDISKTRTGTIWEITRDQLVDFSVQS